jgi:hypothetical protein
MPVGDAIFFLVIAHAKRTRSQWKAGAGGASVHPETKLQAICVGTGHDLHQIVRNRCRAKADEVGQACSLLRNINWCTILAIRAAAELVKIRWKVMTQS